jgi:hypothetical protein
MPVSPDITNKLTSITLDDVWPFPLFYDFYPLGGQWENSKYLGYLTNLRITGSSPFTVAQML